MTSNMKNRIPFSSLSLNLPIIERLTRLRKSEPFKEVNGSWNIFMSSVVDFLEKEFEIGVDETLKFPDETDKTEKVTKQKYPWRYN